MPGKRRYRKYLDPPDEKTPVKQPKVARRPAACPICTTATKAIVLLHPPTAFHPERHWSCLSCIGQWSLQLLREKHQTNLECLHCLHVPVDHDVVRTAVRTASAHMRPIALEHRMCAVEICLSGVRGMPDYHSCPSKCPGGGWLGAELNVACPVCKRCWNPAVARAAAERSEKVNIQWVESNTRPCPKCHVRPKYLDHFDTHGRCRAKFCWVCSKPLGNREVHLACATSWNANPQFWPTTVRWLLRIVVFLIVFTLLQQLLSPHKTQ